MSKHTPGPWILSKWEDETYVRAPLGNDEYGDVAMICGDLEGDEANARLIKTAPNLLEALKGLVRLLDVEAKAKAFRNPELKAALAAIAEAGGEGS